MASKTTNYGLHKFDLTDSPPDITAINDSMDKIDTELKKRVENTKALPVENGGTGKATKKEAFDNLAFLGNNPISSTDEDTTQKWLELGSGYAKFDTNNLMINQPEQYMFVINCSHESSAIFQIGSLQSGNGVYYRTGNYSGWTVNWTPLFGANSIVPIANGGTGKATKKEAFANLAFLGNNPISSTSEDTTVKWGELGSGYAWFYTDGLMINQPYPYMFVISYYSNDSGDVFQIGSNQKSGTVYYRTGNGSGWLMNWTPLLSTNNTSLLATTIQNLIDKGEIHMEKQYIISDSGMTTETFANNVSCIGLHGNEIKVLGKFFPQYNGLILVKTKATNNYSGSLSLHHSNLHDGNRYGSSSLHSAENYYMTNQAAADKEATMLYNNVKISPGTILNNADTTLVSMSSEIDTWYQNATGYSYKVLMVQKNMPVTFYCNSSNSKSDSGLTNITLQIMYKVV